MKTVVFGFGPIGRLTAERLAAAGDEVVVAQRSPPQNLPSGVRFAPCDATIPEAARAAARGADRIVIAVGLPYTGHAWRAGWPLVMAGVVAAAEDTGARTVFVDNLYMYGPQRGPLTETLPIRDYGQKPASRAAATRVWRAAADAGRIRFAALRVSDFFGPGVQSSQLGAAAFGRLAQGKPAALLVNPDTLHDFAYAPDVARAVETLLVASDDAYGRAWHLPCAPTRTPRQLLALAAAALGRPLRVTALPPAALPILGLFSPLLRETAEMRFLLDRPYLVDGSPFASRFGFIPTPFEISLPETARAFAAEARS